MRNGNILKLKSYIRAIRGPLPCLTRRGTLLLSASPASCSHIGKSQAPAAAAAAAAATAAAAAALLTASVSGHLPPGTALLWTKTDSERDQWASDTVTKPARTPVYDRIKFKCSDRSRSVAAAELRRYSGEYRSHLGGGLNGNSPPLAELAQLGTDNGSTADGIGEWVCLETGRVVLEGYAELDNLKSRSFYSPKSFVFLTERQWCSGRNHPSLFLPVRCKGPSQAGFSVIRELQPWLWHSENMELRAAQTSV